MAWPADSQRPFLQAHGVQVPRAPAALALHRQIERLDPGPVRAQLATRGADMQRAIGLEADPQRRAMRRDRRRQALVFADLVVIATIRQQCNTQFRRRLRRRRQQPKRDAGGVAGVLDPDTLFEQQICAGETPHRHTTFQTEALQLQVTGGLYHPAGPAVGEQRPAPPPVVQCRIRLHGEQGAAQRRMQGRYQQAVVTACQGPRYRAAGVTAAPVGKPPFTPLRQLEFTTDFPAEANQARRVAAAHVANAAGCGWGSVADPEPTRGLDHIARTTCAFFCLLPRPAPLHLQKQRHAQKGSNQDNQPQYRDVGQRVGHHHWLRGFGENLQLLTLGRELRTRIN